MSLANLSDGWVLSFHNFGICKLDLKCEEQVPCLGKISCATLYIYKYAKTVWFIVLLPINFPSFLLMLCNHKDSAINNLSCEVEILNFQTLSKQYAPFITRSTKDIISWLAKQLLVLSSQL